MKSTNVLKRVLLFALLLASVALKMSAQTNHLIISQIYGGGGNSGAVYTNDFVELYNPTSAAISLSGYSLQYTSAAGTSWGSNLFDLSSAGSVLPHDYFLIQLQSASKTGASLPTPDATGSINLNTTTGKIILSNSTTALTGSCPTTNVVDLVGYGGANCFEGAVASGTGAGNTTAFSRSTPPVDTDNNAADFTVITPPNPHNSSYNNGGSSGNLSIASATANPSSVTAGNMVTFSVTVTPGTNSQGISSVTANLAAIGGSATQAFALSSTANIYTFQATVLGSTAANSYSIPVTVMDADSETATGSIALTVQSPVTSSPISTMQANRSVYVGTTITTTGVITLVTDRGFYIQMPSSTPGSTGVSEGLFVFDGIGKVPSTAVVGNNVTITGKLALYPTAAVSHTSPLELDSPAITVNSGSQPLPAAITLPTPTATGGIYQLTKYESMRVMVPSMTAVGGTDGNLAESTETVTSNGQFYAVLGNTPRPFREPGMDFRDFPTATCPSVTNCTATATAAGVARPSNLTLYDDNPERIVVESSLGSHSNVATGTPLDVSTGAVVTNTTGVLDFSYSTDVPYGDPARFIMDPGVVSSANYTAGMKIQALPVPGANQFTVAAFNIERFFNPNPADDLYYDPVAKTTTKSEAVDITQAAYNIRKQKVSLAVRTILNNPDIISFEEAENVSVLKDIAQQIDTDAGTAGATPPGYVAYGTDSVNTFTDDIGGISIGFLVKPSTVDVVTFEQMGAASTYVNASGSAATLNDRPSDVLHAGIKRGTGVKDYPITVISNHLRSLDSVNSSVDVRTKKELQAEMLATLIQGYQQNKEHVIAVGDMNVFQFSDGYTDVMGTITGNVGTNIAAQPGKAIVSPAAVDLVTLLPAVQQQSYVEWGNAQVLDHVVVTADLAGSTTLAYGHIDSDFPNILYNDPTTPAAESDHDPALAYLALPAPATTGTLTGTGTFASQGVGTTSAGQQFTITNTGEAAITISSIVATGDFAQTNTCGTSLAINSTCLINVVFKPTAAGSRTGTLTVTSNATGISTAALTGTGATPDFTLAGTSGTTSVTVAAGSTGTVGLTFTSTNGFSGSVTLACAATGTAPTGVTCTVASPVTLAAGGTTTANVTFTTTTRTATAALMSRMPSSTTGRLVCLALLLASGMAFSTLRRGRRGLALLATLLFVVAIGVSGCGSSSPVTTNPAGTPAGSYAYTVTATSGATSHTQAVMLTVQ